MSILIVGGGVVGSQVARILAESGRSPVIFDRAPQPEAIRQIVGAEHVEIIKGDVLKGLDLAGALRNVQAIIHTAANPMLTAGAQKRPYDAIELNIMGTANVLEAASIFGVAKVIVVSSSVLTSNLEGGEDNGDLTREEALPRPKTFYAATKQAVEGIALNYWRWKALDVRIVRYAAVAGPWGGGGGGEPTNIFRGMLEGAMSGSAVEVPNATIEWIYSKDAARGTLLALDAEVGRERVFNLSMGCATTPAALAGALRSAFPAAKIGIKAGETPVHRGAMKLDRARLILGYAPEFQMPDAIRDYAAWLQGHSSRPM